MDILASLINQVGPLLIAAGVPLVIAVFKQVVPKIPKPLLPMLAPVLGAGGDFLLSLLVQVPATGWMGALAGLAGVGIREVVVQAQRAIPTSQSS